MKRTYVYAKMRIIVALNYIVLHQIALHRFAVCCCRLNCIELHQILCNLYVPSQPDRARIILNLIDVTAIQLEISLSFMP